MEGDLSASGGVTGGGRECQSRALPHGLNQQEVFDAKVSTKTSARGKKGGVTLNNHEGYVS